MKAAAWQARLHGCGPLERHDVIARGRIERQGEIAAAGVGGGMRKEDHQSGEEDYGRRKNGSVDLFLLSSCHRRSSSRGRRGRRESIRLKNAASAIGEGGDKGKPD